MFATVAVGIKTLFLKTLILPIIMIHNESHLNRLLVHSDSSITGKWSHILPPLERIHETSHNNTACKALEQRRFLLQLLEMYFVLY